MRTRGRIWGTLFLLSYPFISIGLSTVCFAAGKSDRLTSLGTGGLNCNHLLGLLAAAARSEVPILRYCGYPLIVGPVICGFLFVWVVQK